MELSAGLSPWDKLRWQQTVLNTRTYKYPPLRGGSAIEKLSELKVSFTLHVYQAGFAIGYQHGSGGEMQMFHKYSRKNEAFLRSIDNGEIPLQLPALFSHFHHQQHSKRSADAAVTATSRITSSALKGRSSSSSGGRKARSDSSNSRLLHPAPPVMHYYNGAVVVKLVDYRSLTDFYKEPATYKVLLRPNCATIQADIDEMVTEQVLHYSMKNKRPPSDKATEELRLHSEQEVLNFTKEVCLDPSPRVCQVLNMVSYGSKQLGSLVSHHRRQPRAGTGSSGNGSDASEHENSEEELAENFTYGQEDYITDDERGFVRGGRQSRSSTPSLKRMRSQMKSPHLWRSRAGRGSRYSSSNNTSPAFESLPSPLHVIQSDLWEPLSPNPAVTRTDSGPLSPAGGVSSSPTTMHRCAAATAGLPFLPSLPGCVAATLLSDAPEPKQYIPAISVSSSFLGKGLFWKPEPGSAAAQAAEAAEAAEAEAAEATAVPTAEAAREAQAAQATQGVAAGPGVEPFVASDEAGSATVSSFAPDSAGVPVLPLPNNYSKESIGEGAHTGLAGSFAQQLDYGDAEVMEDEVSPTARAAADAETAAALRAAMPAPSMQKQLLRYAAYVHHNREAEQNRAHTTLRYFDNPLTTFKCLRDATSIPLPTARANAIGSAAAVHKSKQEPSSSATAVVKQEGATQLSPAAAPLLETAAAEDTRITIDTNFPVENPSERKINIRKEVPERSIHFYHTKNVKMGEGTVNNTEVRHEFCTFARRCEYTPKSMPFMSSGAHEGFLRILGAGQKMEYVRFPVGNETERDLLLKELLRQGFSQVVRSSPSSAGSGDFSAPNQQQNASSNQQRQQNLQKQPPFSSDDRRSTYSEKNPHPQNASDTSHHQQHQQQLRKQEQQRRLREHLAGMSLQEQMAFMKEKFPQYNENQVALYLRSLQKR